MTHRLLPYLICCLTLFLSLPITAQAQKKQKKAATTATTQYEPSLYDAIEWRSIGPYRGGRSAAVTGVEGKPNLFYFGATGGGVWRTKDGGQTWENISDGYFGGSVGAVAGE